MNNQLELTKRSLHSESSRRTESESIPLEDSQFISFTNFLDEIEVFKNPVISRGMGKFKAGNWSLLGYGANNYRQIVEEDEEEEKNEGSYKSAAKFDVKWEFTLFNGFFTDELTITRLTKHELEKAVKETERFLDKTFARDLVNDTNQVRDLQDQLIEHFSRNNLERVDICIITDKLIDHDNLPSKFEIKEVGLEGRIYYWDLRRWDAIKRSKSKREPINIDFKSSDFQMYNVPYLHQTTGRELDYYLSIFPGDLIADLYDIHNTRMLENNVRVFLSATKKANKGIRDTIGLNEGADAFKFFSYNNGISATAESIEIFEGRIIRISDFQIVNGGQTTATIHYSRKRDRKNLKDVYVSVKITALKKDENYSKIVGSISEAANTQSAISNSDFFANDKQLVMLEQISHKNPTQNEVNRNVYYYFERMKGQYNVTMSSQGTKTQQSIWASTYPKDLSFNKLDLARWSNMMMGFPYHAAEGSEKQFKTFMNNEYFERVEMHLGNFKTLVGFGVLFKRIHKLCGTATGKEHLYPSRIIDFVTKKHVPVAMSTAIYTSSFLHHITNGRINYWAIFDYKYNLSYSVVHPHLKDGNDQVRIDSEIDGLLKEFIDLIWEQIAKFGGAAAQEKSKKKECWTYLLNNISIPYSLNERLEKYLISESEYSQRSEAKSNEKEIYYFEYLDLLLRNNGLVLSNLHAISKLNNDYINVRSTISNLIKKVQNREQVITFKRVEEVCNFYEELVVEGFQFNDYVSSELKLDFNFNLIELYNEIFNNDFHFLERINVLALKDVDSRKLFLEAKSIIEGYYDLNGLSCSDINKLSLILSKLSN
jgi:hypothetical protein